MAQTEIFLSTGLLVDLAMVNRMGATLGLCLGLPGRVTDSIIFSELLTISDHCKKSQSRFERFFINGVLFPLSDTHDVVLVSEATQS